MLSNSGERWLISMTDMPEPRQSSNSSRMRSSTESGSALGPALKLKTRFTDVREALNEDTIWNSSLWRRIFVCDAGRTLAWAHQNIMARCAGEHSANGCNRAGVKSRTEKEPHRTDEKW